MRSYAYIQYIDAFVSIFVSYDYSFNITSTKLDVCLQIAIIAIIIILKYPEIFTVADT